MRGLQHNVTSVFIWGFPSGSDGKESASSAGGMALIPGLGRFPEEGNGYPLQCSCLENSMDRGGWQARVHGVTKNQTLLSNSHFHFFSVFKRSNSETDHQPRWDA